MSNSFDEWCSDFMADTIDDLNDQSDQIPGDKEAGIIVIMLPLAQEDSYKIQFLSNIHSNDIKRVLKSLTADLEGAFMDGPETIQ